MAYYRKVNLKPRLNQRFSNLFLLFTAKEFWNTSTPDVLRLVGCVAFLGFGLLGIIIIIITGDNIIIVIICLISHLLIPLECVLHTLLHGGL